MSRSFQSNDDEFSSLFESELSPRNCRNNNLRNVVGRFLGGKSGVCKEIIFGSVEEHDWESIDSSNE